MSDQEGDPFVTEPKDGKRLRDAWNALADEVDGVSDVNDADIWRTLASEGSVDEREAIVDRLALDPAAAESWRLAQELHRELAERESSYRSVTVVPLWRRRWVAVAATLLLAAGLVLSMQIVDLPSAPPDEPVFRDPAAVQLLSLIPEDVPQPQDQVTLSWSGAGEGVRYTVRVLGSDFEPLSVQRELTATEVRVPSERLSDIAATERLMWQVEARWPDGQIATSPTFFLYLAPAQKTLHTF